MVPQLPTVYVETSVFSLLAGRPSRDLVVAGHQRMTAEWWHEATARFRLVTSALVLREASAGDPQAAAARARLIAGLPLLPSTPEAAALGEDLVRTGSLPLKAKIDAMHVAIAALAHADYLVTWNMRHLAGAVVRRQIERALRARGHEPPTLCTPEELLPDPLPGDPDE